MKISFKKPWLLSLPIIALAIFSAWGCKKNISPTAADETGGVKSATGTTAKKAGPSIRVSTIAELYAAVNLVTNAGRTIQLEPGIYTLDPTFPNNGRIELQENMALIGKEGHPEDVIIDASALPDNSFNPPLNFPARRTSAIRVGRGYNIIEWLKVIGNPNPSPLSVIDTDLIWPGVAQVRIAHTIVTGGRIGIDLRNVGPASINRIIEAEIDDNELTGNTVSDPGTQQGQGLVIQNANGAMGAVVNVTMNGNNIHDNIIGIRAFNNNCNANTHNDNARITINSKADKIDKNKLGIYMIGGSNGGAVNASTNGNYLSFEANGTSIQQNAGINTDAITTPCGIRITGGFNNVAGSSASENQVILKLTGTTIAGNAGFDIVSFGAFSTNSVLAGLNNSVRIYLNGVSAKATVAPPVFSVPGLPLPDAATNTVSISN